MWTWPVLFVVCGAVIAATSTSVVPLTAAVVLIVAGVLFSPLSFPRHRTDAVARERAATEGRPIVYWRPGCPYCMRLRLTLLGRARRASWVNIWRDPEAAAAVREVAAGNETVPTVILPAGPRVNPDPSWVRHQLRREGAPGHGSRAGR